MDSSSSMSVLPEAGSMASWLILHATKCHSACMVVHTEMRGHAIMRLGEKRCLTMDIISPCYAYIMSNTLVYSPVLSCI